VLYYWFTLGPPFACWFYVLVKQAKYGHPKFIDHASFSQVSDDGKDNHILYTHQRSHVSTGGAAGSFTPTAICSSVDVDATFQDLVPLSF
jgi:hypothetical protein